MARAPTPMKTRFITRPVFSERSTASTSCDLAGGEVALEAVHAAGAEGAGIGAADLGEATVRRSDFRKPALPRGSAPTDELAVGQAEEPLGGAVGRLLLSRHFQGRGETARRAGRAALSGGRTSPPGGDLPVVEVVEDLLGAAGGLALATSHCVNSGESGQQSDGMENSDRYWVPVPGTVFDLPFTHSDAGALGELPSVWMEGAMMISVSWNLHVPGPTDPSGERPMRFWVPSSVRAARRGFPQRAGDPT